MTEIKRLNYFDAQFLHVDDFNDEQAYHLAMRRLHNQWLHGWGVAGDGLQVAKKGDKVLQVGAGLAIDKDGREIVLLAPGREVPLDSAATPNATLYLTASYHDEDSKDAADKDPSTQKYKRRTESPIIVAKPPPAPASDGSVILLATLKLDAKGNIEGVQNDGRRPSGPAPGAVAGPLTITGSLNAAGGIAMNDQQIRLKAYVDSNDSLGYRDKYGGIDVYGPVLSGNAGGALSVTGDKVALSWKAQDVTVHGSLNAAGGIAMNDQQIRLKAYVDSNDSLGYRDKYGGIDVYGPVLSGNAGGALSVTGDKVALSWKAQDVTVHGSLTVGGLTIAVEGANLTVRGHAVVRETLTVSNGAERQPSGANTLDVQTGKRTGTHRNALAVYVTGNTDPFVEFRHTDGKQGIGFGPNTITAMGTEGLTLKATGSGRVIIEQEKWIPAELVNKWEDHGGGFSTAGYFKDSLGIVHLKGLVKGGNQGSGDAGLIFKLRSGYQPEQSLIFLVHAQSALGRLDVDTNGNVILYVCSQKDNVSELSLNGITFRAANP